MPEDFKKFSLFKSVSGFLTTNKFFLYSLYATGTIFISASIIPFDKISVGDSFSLKPISNSISSAFESAGNFGSDVLASVESFGDSIFGFESSNQSNKNSASILDSIKNFFGINTDETIPVKVTDESNVDNVVESPKLDVPESNKPYIKNDNFSQQINNDVIVKDEEKVKVEQKPSTIIQNVYNNYPQTVIRETINTDKLVEKDNFSGQIETVYNSISNSFDAISDNPYQFKDDLTVLGDLHTSADIIGLGSITGTYLTASSLVATSTFNGSLDVANNSLFVDANTGRVGIGTTSPLDILHIASTLPKFYITDTDSATDNKHWFLENNAGSLYFGTTTDALAVSNTRALSIRNDGTIIITTSPPGVPALPASSDYGSKFVVQGGTTVTTGAAGTITLTNTSNSMTTGDIIGSLNFYNNDASSNAKGVRAQISGGIDDATGRNGILTFLTGASASPTEKMRIDSSGNIGIGTTSPTSKLTVNGEAYFNNAIMLENSTPASTGNKLYANASNLYWSGNLIAGASSGNWTTDGTNAWRATGSVGVGTSSPWAQLSVNPNGLTGPSFVIGSSTATNFIVTNGGDVGIGTKNPTSRLNVNAGSNLSNLGNFNFLSFSGDDFTQTMTSFFESNSSKSFAFFGPGSTTGGAGGLSAVGISKNSALAAGTLITGYFEETSPTGSQSAVMATAWKNNGSGDRTSLASTEKVFAVKNGTTNLLNILGSGNVGIGSTTPFGLFSINPTNGITGPSFVIGSSTRAYLTMMGPNLGLGNTDPQATLHVGPYVNNPATFPGKIILKSTQSNGATSGPNSSDGIELVQADTNSGYGMKLYTNSSNDTNGIATRFNSPTWVERLIINSVGNIGIASTSPFGLLSVNPNGITGPSFVIGSSTATNLIVTNSGNVGIGTKNPLQKLAVSNSGAEGIEVVPGYSSGLSIFQAYNRADSTYDDLSINASSYIFDVGGDGTYDMVLANNGRLGIASTTPFGLMSINPAGITGPAFVIGSSTATNLIVTNGGRVGIGSSLPLATLHVEGLNGTSHVRFGDVTASDGSPSAKMLFQGNGVDHGGFLFTPSLTPDNEKFQFTHGGSPDPALQTALFTITGGGKIGIGTTSPSSNLTIRGATDDYANLFIKGAGTRGVPQLILDRGSDGRDQAGVQMKTNGTFNWFAGIPYDNGAVTSDYVIGSSVDLSGAKLMINSSGNVGIGTTSPLASGLEIVRSGFAENSAHLKLWTNSTDVAGNGANYLQLQRNGGNTSTLVPTANNMNLGRLEFFGVASDSTVTRGATIKASQNGAAGLNGVPTDITFTTSDGTNAAADRMVIANTGKVGIGTSTPVSTLSVQGSLCVRSTGSCGTTDGTIYATTAAVTDIDLAENYPTADSTLSAGEIVMFDNSTSESAFIKRADRSSGGTIMGIISTAPGLLLGRSLHNITKPVALSGRVPLKVNNENGSIAIGDRIALSSIPGVGMKAPLSGETVAIALEAFDGSKGNGKIEVFVNLRNNIDLSPIELVKKGITDLNLRIDLMASTTKDLIIDESKSVVYEYFKSIKEWTLEKITVAKGYFTEIFADKVNTKQLCIEEVCLTKDQLNALIINMHASSTEPVNAIPTVTVTASPSPTVAPESVSTPTVIATPTPVSTPTATPEVTPTESITPSPTPTVQVAPSPTAEPMVTESPIVIPESAPVEQPSEPQPTVENTN